MKKQNRDQKRKQFKYEINKNKKKKLVDPDALNDKGDNKTLRELAGLGAVLGAGAAGMAFMPNNTVHAAEQTAADQKSAVVGSVSANEIPNEGSVAQEQNNSKTQLDKTVNSEDKESSSTTSDVKSESTDSVLSSENKSNHKSKLTDSVSSVNDNSKSIASTSSVSNNSKSIASISSVNSNSNNNSASAVSTRLSNISDSIISNNSNKSLSSLKAKYRTLKNFDLKALSTKAIATKSVESQTIKTHDQDVSNKLTNVDTTLSYNDQSQTNEIKSGLAPTIHPEMSEGLHTNISFTVPKDVGAGDFFDISWSKNMNLYGTHDPDDSSYDTGIQITDQEGNVIAKEDKSNSPITGNKIRLVFTDYVNTHNNVSGNINFPLFIDPKNVPNDSTETLQVGIGNQQISRKVDVQYTAIKRGTVSISNRYYYDLANGEAFITKTNFTDHKVTSVVYVNPLGYDLRNGVSVDIQNLEDSDINFMPGQGGGDGPLQYTVYRIKDDAEPNQSFYIDHSQVTNVTDSTSWTSDNQSLTINMPTDEPSNSRYIITYTTTYNSNTQTQQGKYEVPLKTRTTISTTTDDGVDNSFYWDNLNTYHPGSASGSGTPAQSASASASRASYSASESASQASHSASVSASQASHSASESASQASHSASVSASQASHSASVSSSQSNSESVSASQSGSESVSASQSGSESVSASQSGSESVSASQSNSESVSSSQSNSESVSTSESVSSSQSGSESVSTSESVSSSQSNSESVSSSQSGSESVSTSESVSSSQSNSESVSSSQSGSESVSTSESVSSSQSGSESVSTSESVSSSQSGSESVSTSESVSSSQSGSESVSSTESVSSSQSGSESVSSTESVSSSQSGSESVSSTESVSSSQSGSNSQSQSTSVVRPLPESSQSQSVSTINSLSTSHQSQSTSVVRPLPTNYRPEVDKSLGSTTSVEKGKLPQTGANNNTFGATLMGGLATLLGLIGFKKRNRKDDEK